MDSSTWGLTGTGAYRTEVEWATRISSSGEFVHAAPWSVDSQGVENVSHGCVNVSTDAAKWFYDTFIPGDPVIIRNTVGPALEVWDGFGDFQLPFDQYVASA
jgi:lipoprotein-anchoring transpeptidase ErfK/SrfK